MIPTACSLAGRTIVVTRPQHQASSLAAMIEKAGGHALRFPLIEIEPVTSPALESTIARLESFDLAIFISRNAVEHGLDRVRALGRWPEHIGVAAIGGATRRALEAQGLTGVISPDGPADSESLLKHPKMASLAGRSIVVFRGAGGREFLARELRARGASLTYAECYRRNPPTTDPGPLLCGLASGAISAVAVSSGDALANLARMLGSGASDLLVRTRLFVPHRRLVRVAQSLGVPEPVVAGPGDEDMLSALVAYFGRAG